MFKHFSLLVVLTMFLLFTLPLFAQGETATPNSPPPTDTAPVVIVNNPPAPASDEIAITGAQLLAYIVLAIAAGGGGLAIVYRVLDNRNVQDVVEKTYESWNPDTQQIIKNVLADYKAVNERIMTFLERVTDGQPNAEAVRTIVRSEMQNVRNPVAQTDTTPRAGNL